MTSLKKNDLVEISITGYTAEGSGIGHWNGMAVFIPLTAVGDTVEARILKVAKTHAFGKMEHILIPSSARIQSDCPQFQKCGGCVFRHIHYAEELRAKEQRVRDAIERIGGFQNILIHPILGAEQPDGYRNKAQIPIGRTPDGELTMGFYANHSHRIIDCAYCQLQPPSFQAAMDAFRTWAALSGDEPYNEATGKGRLRHLYLRQAEATGEEMVCVVVNGNGVHKEDILVRLLRERIPGLKSVMINTNRERTNVVLGKKNRVVWGQDYITDRLCDLDFHISPLSFYQVNRTQAERLYRQAAVYAGLTGHETLLDLYCGTGTIGLSMAAQAKRVIGVEVVPSAVEDAIKNAERNHITNAEFFCMDAAEAAFMLRQRGEYPDVVILDPPRKGCSGELLRTVVQMSPKRIVYVSCDPATLARDLRILADLHYIPQELTPVDMFPRTAHVETVVLLSKLNTKQHIEVELNLDELDLTSAESKATYDEIKAYVLEKHGLKVSSLYISQVKRKCGLDVGQNYNLSKKENAKVPKCPPEKEAAIMDALKYFQMIM